MARFFNRIRQSVDALLAPADLPPSGSAPLGQLESNLRQIQDARERLEGAAGALARRVQAMEQRAEELRGVAVADVAHGRTDLARLALAQRHTALLTGEGLRRQRTDLEDHVARLVLAEQQLVGSIEALTSRRELITAQRQAALVQIEVGETLTGLNDADHAQGRSLDLAEAAMETLQDRAIAIRRLIDDDLLDLHPSGIPTVNPDIDAAVDAELASIQRQCVQQPHGQRSKP